jgi:hypothetical protein
MSCFRFTIDEVLRFIHNKDNNDTTILFLVHTIRQVYKTDKANLRQAGFYTAW